MNILVLGPFNRNKNIISKLENIGHHVSHLNIIVDIALLSEYQIEFIIVNGYSPIIKESIISSYKNKIVNIHPAYLPQGRGIYPNFWSYFEGYKKGVTIHYIDSGIDTGNIIIRQEAVIGLCETLRSSNKILMNLAEQVFMDNIDNIIHGKLVVLEQSEEECDSFYHSRTLSERYVEILPNCWDTGIDYCTSMGRDFFISAQFIDKYIKELHD